MPQKANHVQLSARERQQLSARERQQLESYVKHGKHAARALTRARILLLADEDYGDEEICDVLGVSRPTGPDAPEVLGAHGRKHSRSTAGSARPGQPVKLDSRVAAHVAIIACSEAPPGAAGKPAPFPAQAGQLNDPDWSAYQISGSELDLPL